MSWEKVKQYFEGAPEDLIEVYYHGMEKESWARLFSWLQGRVLHLETQYGTESPEELNIKKYLSGEISYVANTKCSNGMALSLSIIDEDMLQIDIEKEEVQSAENYNNFITSVCEIATVINSKNYIICPEFKQSEAFIVNGVIK